MKEQVTRYPSCVLCQSDRFLPVFTYDAPPVGEVRFAITSGSGYQRTIDRCAVCGLFVSHHDIDMSNLYSGEYVDATYGKKGIQETFNRVINLPPERSDNAGRVKRIADFCRSHFESAPFSSISVLDIGSGLGVFPYAMKKAGFNCTALDPDARAIAHTKETVGVTAIHGDFLTVAIAERFHLITFNKVLEHVLDPVHMLARAGELLAKGGLVYVELPDGEAAEKDRDGKGREEFFIDHHYMFSPASLMLLATRAGFSVLHCAHLQEPSTKYTTYAFLKK